MKRYFLYPDVTIKVVYEDTSRFGSPMSNKTDWIVRELFSEVLDLVGKNGYRQIEIAAKMSEKVVKSEAFATFFDVNAAVLKIRDEVIYPEVELVKPDQLLLVREKTQQKIEVVVPENYWSPVHDLLSELERDGIVENDPLLSDDMNILLSNLIKGGFVFTESEFTLNKCQIKEPAITFLGHNTVLISYGKNKVIVDPLMFPTSEENPETYQPLQLRELGLIDAIIITHSHPDHFDPGSLLRFSTDTLIIVPRADRETILSAAMEYRLKELGFTNVKVLDWWKDIHINDIHIHSLPFYGEQPTDGDTLNPSIRNSGNTYLVKTGNFSSLFLADSGFDGLGNIKDLSNEIRKRFGKVNVVFSGYRGWILYPFQFLFSSVARYLLFVPPSQWGARQQIMTTAEQAVDVAERVGADFLIPYADGGAPWHWRIELGPQLDGNGKEVFGFDYFPEKVLQVAENRAELIDGSIMKSFVKTLIMRPNQSLIMSQDNFSLNSLPGNKWPYNIVKSEELVASIEG